MSGLWMIPALVGGMFCALIAQYLAARVLARLGVPLTCEVETERVGDLPVIQHQRTRVSLAVDVIAYLGGLVGGLLGIAYLIQLLGGG
jgi:hypothetical protein